MIIDSEKMEIKPVNWKENFRYYLSGAFIRKECKEGKIMPRFYLPVWRPADKDALELWILPLAPIVWILYVVKDILWLIWRDMLDLQKNITRYRRIKK